MEPKQVCPICGSLLKVNLFQPPAAPWQWDTIQWDTRPWYTEARGIYAVDDDMSQITATGVGVIRNGGTLRAPVHQDRAYFNEPYDSLMLWTIRRSSASGVCFAFHESCWKLLLLRLRHGNTVRDDASIMQSVFYLLYHTPDADSSDVCSYGDDRSFRDTDPCALPSLSYIENLTGGLYDEVRCRGQDGAQPRAVELRSDCERPLPYDSRIRANLRGFMQDSLSRLPVEILYEVLTYLPFDEIGNVRRTCHYLARLASITMLPQSYWRSRFMLGQELDYIFPCTTETRDWFRLWSGIKVYQRHNRQLLVNRWQIRKRLEPLASLVDLYPLIRNGPQGFSYRPVKSRGRAPILVDIMGSKEGPCLTNVMGYLSAELTSVEEYHPLDPECQMLYRRAQPFEALGELCQMRCIISTVQLGSGQFISGIRVCQSGAESGTSQLIGYPNPDKETWIDIPKCKRIRAFNISVCPEGLRGIQILYTGSSESRWVGEEYGPGIAQGTLFVPSGKKQRYLLADLDRFKIIALGFGEMAGRHERASNSPPSSTVATRSSRARLHLWEPRILRHGGIVVRPILPLKASRTFNPLLNFDFGGYRGRHLRFLTRLQFHLTHDRHPLIGLAAHYSNGSSVHCGSLGGNVMSIFLDGPKGERVTQIRILKDPAVRLVGLQVSTSYGRTVTFAPLFHQLSASVKPISGLPARHTITGLVVHPMSYKGPFEQLRIQSQVCRVPPTRPGMRNRESHRVPEDQIRYDMMLHQRNDNNDMRFYPTYASLKRVRRITASTGGGAHSRPPPWITGLKIEYQDDRSPGVVGQWIHPLPDVTIELSPDEEIESLTVWVMSYSTWEFPQMRTGHIAAISISTTERSLELAATERTSTWAIQGQYQRDIDEELTAISWVLREKSDRVRAVISATGPQKRYILIPPLSPRYRRVRKLYFERPDGVRRRKKLYRAEVYFDYVQIVGLRFIYRSGHCAAIGDIDGCSLGQNVYFPEYDKITGFSVKALGSALMQIEFEVKQGKSQKCLKLGKEDHLRYTYDRHFYWGESQCPDEVDTPTDTNQQRPNKKVCNPPSNSRLTGMYVDCGWISVIGAIYEPVGSP
ncbi:hypothetical protein AbraIFM66951_010837 [Aspergillus brasiliensis]|uniref:F-box domain-containing protein n=1 Tax=Aspergillus brasiliensis TaxID=319629 RepID=A0A9W5YKT5_9EURO|nr:hypothetical protein AbraCBS73388_010076 [Aspergillus brasiliensis]GKZ47470.1 hypothetical protein AbraIFM66951_010837 [Aspergillus brasiliensis]